MSEPDNPALRLLKKLRDDIAGVKAEMRSGFETVDRRIEAMDKKLESVKQAAFGESILGRYAVAEVEERLLKLEEIMALKRS